MFEEKTARSWYGKMIWEQKWVFREGQKLLEKSYQPTVCNKVLSRTENRFQGYCQRDKKSLRHFGIGGHSSALRNAFSLEI